MQVPQIIEGMTKKNRELQMKVDELESLAESMAQAEREYKMMYAKRLLELKGEGTPMAIITDVARGDKVVAELKFKADVQQAVFNACRERIRSINAAIDTYRSILSWNKMEYEKAGLS